MKALFINGSPRKKWNTVQLLEKAIEGSKAAGAETELIHLYDQEFTGCKSCFVCKTTDSKANGLCVLQDKARSLLEKAYDADVIILGSPVYYGYPTGQLRSFLERMLFPFDTYTLDENGERTMRRKKKVATGMIYTMNVPESLFPETPYEATLGFTGEELGRVLGYNELLYVYDTWQFADYEKYNVTLFDVEQKRKRREEHFPQDLQNAYDLGLRLTEKARVLNS